MRSWFLAAMFCFSPAAAGCLQIDSPDGTLTCSDSPDRPCPHGFYCLQPNNTCWRNGHVPHDMAQPPPDFSFPSRDFSVNIDMTDLAAPADFAVHD